MTSPIISVENLGKRYTLSHQQPDQYTALRDVIAGGVSSLARRLCRPFLPGLSKDDATPSSEDFWALKDVNFQVQPGERLGIIGRNGAGKSTLLKILSRITEPTTGSIRIRGRVASLLEVGTGFHPELTGRENIFLNGAILGMQREEIRRKFDQIVDFAEIERFLDTPVKRYSSGMYVRLAFAVAAHLEPEVLVVDEVLAVGDAGFQKKCLGKMEAMAQGEGRTVLFVSHQMQAIQSICNNALILKNGELDFHGPTQEALDRYLLTPGSRTELRVSLHDLPRSGGDQLAIKEAWVENAAGKLVKEVFCGEKIRISYRFEANRRLVDPGFGFSIDTSLGVRLSTYGNYIEEPEPLDSVQFGTVSFTLPKNMLLPGRYLINFGLSERRKTSIDYVQGALELTVLPSDVFGTGKGYEASHGFYSMDVSLSLQKDRA